MQSVENTKSLPQLAPIQSIYINGGCDDNIAYGCVPTPCQFSVLERIGTAISKDRFVFKMIHREIMNYLSHTDGHSWPMHDFEDDRNPYEETLPDGCNDVHDVQHLAVFLVDREQELAYLFLDLESYHSEAKRPLPDAMHVPPKSPHGLGFWDKPAGYKCDNVTEQYTLQRAEWDRMDSEKGIRRFKYRPGNSFYWERNFVENEDLQQEANRIISTPDHTVMLVAHDLKAYPLPADHVPHDQWIYGDGASTAGVRDWFEQRCRRGIGRLLYPREFSRSAIYRRSWCARCVSGVLEQMIQKIEDKQQDQGTRDGIAGDMHAVA
jgi:hypothetical protein